MIVLLSGAIDDKINTYRGGDTQRGGDTNRVALSPCDDLQLIEFAQELASPRRPAAFKGLVLDGMQPGGEHHQAMQQVCASSVAVLCNYHFLTN